MYVTTPTTSPTVNVANRLSEIARRFPNHPGVIVADGRDSSGRRRYKSYTFAELDADSNRLARGLLSLGVEPGTRLALMVRPGFDFTSLVFALFKSGAVSVLIDPGMGRRNLLRCLDEAKPQGFVAIPAVHAVRALLRRRYADARFNVTVGRRWFWGARTLESLRRQSPHPLTSSTQADDPAAIIFTTGSTGPPKGVLYRHGNFDRQVEEIRDAYAIQPGELDVACFPLFALFNCALGVATYFPEMDFSRPATANPANIIEPINDLRATQAFASPSVWNRVGRHCEQRQLQLPTLRRVLAAGAPVPVDVLSRMKACMSEAGEMHTPYGATEALPVASISASEVLAETAGQTRQGAGVCVGRRFPGIEWKVIRVCDGPIADIAAVEELPPGEIGELIVRGPVVTREYIARPQANALGKIADGDSVWHRMGDVGYLDAQQRFWFCGRMAHRVLTPQGPLFTVPCEAIFNNLAQVFRSALVGVGPAGQQRPAMILEPFAEHWPRTAVQREAIMASARAAGQGNQLTAGIDQFLLHKSFPVDIRHNAKIFREKLAVWATKQLARS